MRGPYVLKMRTCARTGYYESGIDKRTCGIAKEREQIRAYIEFDVPLSLDRRISTSCCGLVRGNANRQRSAAGGALASSRRRERPKVVERGNEPIA
jgi:hypothetical protein